METMQNAPKIFGWYDLMTNDISASTAFYADLVGWTIQEVPMPTGEGHYHMICIGDRGIGGIVKHPNSEQPSMWIPYLTVANVDDFRAKSDALGGKTYMPAEDLPGVGRMALVADPSGAMISPATWSMEMTPADQAPETGDFAWQELQVRASDAPRPYYETLAGWSLGQTLDMGQHGIYEVMQYEGQDICGISYVPNETPFPPHWLPYIQTPDLEALIPKVEALGGQLLVPPSDIPGGGRFMMILDNQNAMVGLMTV